MFGIGMLELVVILVLATIVVGPEKMVEFAGELGRWLAKFRAETSGITREFRDAFDVEIQDIRGELNEFQRDLEGFKDVEVTLSEMGETLSDPLETSQPNTARRATAQGGRPGYNLPGAGDDAMARFQTARQERQQQTREQQQQRQTEERPTVPGAPVELQPDSEPIQEVPTPEIVRDLSPDAEAIEISVGELIGEDDEIEPMVLDGPEFMEDPFASDEAEKDNGSTRSAGSTGTDKAEPVEVTSGQAEDGKEEE